MSLRSIHSLRLRRFAGIALLFLMVAEVHAAPIRVTTWSFQPGTDAGTNVAAPEVGENRIQEAVDVLKKLNADVIILQQVPDWQSCDELAKALAPEKYGVVVCSSFRDARTGTLSKQQVAILSKVQAYISWSEAWKSQGQTNGVAGGFAFAAIRMGNKNAGFFSVQLNDAKAAAGREGGQNAAQPTARELAARQLLQQIASVRHWTANSIQAVVLAGDFNLSPEAPTPGGEKTLALLEESGLTNAFLNVPLEKRITFAGNARRPKATLDYFFTRDAGRVAIPEVLPVTFSERYPVSCDLDLEAPPLPPPPVQVARAEPPLVKAPVIQTNRTSQAASLPAVKQIVAVTTDKQVPWWPAGLLAGVILLMAMVWKLARRTQPQPATATLLTRNAEKNAAIASPPGAERIVIMPRSVQASGSAPGGFADNPPIVHIGAPGQTQTQSQAWQQRAGESERRAERTTAAMRAGLLPHLSRWLKEKLVQKLLSDRAQLLEAQQAAALTALAVDQRLAKLELHIQQRNQVYEQRIEELLQELASAKEENRELIRAKITLVKAEMERERVKALQQSKEHLQN